MNEQDPSTPLHELGVQWPFWAPLEARYMVYWFEVAQQFDPETFQKALDYLISYHDILRLHAQPGKLGSDPLPYIPNMIEDNAVLLINLAALPEEKHPALIQQTVTNIYRDLDAYQGQLSRFVYFDRGAEASGFFLLVLHHGVFDAFSFSILAQDFQTVYLQLLQGHEVKLPPKTTSFAEFLARVRNYIDYEYPLEQSYWRNCVSRLKLWPVDYPEHAIVEWNGTVLREPQARTVTQALSEFDTTQLFRTLPAANIPVLNVFLAAITHVCAQWTGEPVYVHLLDAGRTLFADLDLSRSIGNFSMGRYILLETKKSNSPLETLRVVSQQINRVPFKGAGPSLVDYAQDKGAGIPTAVPPHLTVNYFGPARTEMPEQGFLRNALQYRELTGHPHVTKGYCKIDVVAMVAENRFTVSWSFDEQLYNVSTIEQLLHNILAFLSTVSSEFTQASLRKSR